MKTNHPLHHSLFHQESGGHSVSVIKANQAGLPKANGDLAKDGKPRPSEIRLVETGPDYCDLELICGCGETTRFRCWSAASAIEGKGPSK